MATERVRRTQELRRSGAAGVHDDRKPRSAEERAAIEAELRQAREWDDWNEGGEW